MRAFVLAAVFVTLAARCGFNAPPDLLSASRVEAFRLAPLFDEHYRTLKRFHESKLVSGPRPLSASDAALAARELERIYPIDWPPLACAFAPRYGLRFHLATSTADVLICPHCGEVHFLMGRVLRRAIMRDGAPELMRMLKSLFPRHALRDNEV